VAPLALSVADGWWWGLGLFLGLLAIICGDSKSSAYASGKLCAESGSLSGGVPWGVAVSALR